MTFDKRWEQIAKDWLSDCNVPDRLIEKYWPIVAQQLHDVAEEAPTEIASREHEAHQAARDAHINLQIDEARGK